MLTLSFRHYAVRELRAAVLVQPMFAKMVLPLLGGSPSVWNTCVVFFQAMLLCGYMYSHSLTACARLWQMVVHACWCYPL